MKTSVNKYQGGLIALLLVSLVLFIPSFSFASTIVQLDGYKILYVLTHDSSKNYLYGQVSGSPRCNNFRFILTTMNNETISAISLKVSDMPATFLLGEDTNELPTSFQVNGLSYVCY